MIDPRHIRAVELAHAVVEAGKLADQLEQKGWTPEHSKTMEEPLNNLCRYLFENFPFTNEESSETNAAMVREGFYDRPIGTRSVDVLTPSHLTGMTDIRAIFAILDYTGGNHRLETEWEGRLWCKFWNIEYS